MPLFIFPSFLVLLHSIIIFSEFLIKCFIYPILLSEGGFVLFKSQLELLLLPGIESISNVGFSHIVVVLLFCFLSEEFSVSMLVSGGNFLGLGKITSFFLFISFNSLLNCGLGSALNAGICFKFDSVGLLELLICFFLCFLEFLFFTGFFRSSKFDCGLRFSLFFHLSCSLGRFSGFDFSILLSLSFGSGSLSFSFGFCSCFFGSLSSFHFCLFCLSFFL